MLPYRTLIAGFLAAATIVAAGVVGAGSSAPNAGPPPSLDMRDLTWPEVRDAVARGYTTVIVPTGGIEQNGLHMILAKHDDIVGWAAEKIASELNKTLVVPVVSYVPQLGGNVGYPGTIGISPAAFAGVLEGIAGSLKDSGFKTICFIGDHSDSQEIQAAVAERLTRAWAGSGVRVVQIDAYYDDKAQYAALAAEGETRATIGEHAGIIDTSELMAINSKGVDLTQVASPFWPWAQSGSSGEPSRASAERGKRLIEMRIQAAVTEIRRVLAAHDGTG